MKRREFVGGVLGGLLLPSSRPPVFPSLRRAGWLLIPMDDSQSDHLKAYGLTFRVLERGGKAEWFLNYRSGSFLLPGNPDTQREAAIAGVSAIPIDDGQVAQIRAELAKGN